MKIQIDNHGFTVGDHRFIYNLYFIESDSEFLQPSAGATFKKIVIKWAEVLQGISEERPMFLPFAPDDQWTDCLKACLVSNKIRLTFASLAEGGWGVFDFDLEDFITSSHKIRNESDEVIVECDKDEIIAAMINAEVIDSLC